MNIPSAAPASLLLCFSLAAACGDDHNERRLVLLHTNDEHSHLFGFAPELDDFPAPTSAGNGSIVGGIARRARVLASERAALDEAGVDHLTVSAGDETQGALPQIGFATSSPDFTLMGRLGYDVMCPGNHEFDLGPQAFAASIEAARAAGPMPVVVSSNIHFSDEDGDDDLEALFGAAGSGSPIVPYHVLTTESGLKVGFLGVMGVGASFFAPLKGPVRFSAENPEDEGDQAAVLPVLYSELEPVVDALRNQEGVDVVVAVSHSGVNPDQPELGDDHLIAENVAGIDIIVSGHSHTPLTAPMFAEGPDGHMVPIVQAGSYGRFLGRAELVVRSGERPTIDVTRTGLTQIDDAIVPDELASDLEDLIADLEANALPDQLSLIEGAAVADDPGEVGDLYFRSMGTTSFDVVGLRSSVETNMLNLSTDAMLATAEELAGPTLVAVQASGSVRGDIVAGRTGVMSYADLYRVLPLGMNPLDGTAGYPLCRFHVYTAELKAALEIGVSRGYIEDSLFLGAAGIQVEYDTSRDPQRLTSETAALNPQNGRVTKILLDVDPDDGHDNPTVAVFDLSRSGSEWTSEYGGALALVPVVTSLYIASFADTAGVTLKDENGDPVSLVESILRRGDSTVVKDYEAFMTYVRTISMDNGGELPARYDENASAGAIPRRLLCSGPLCVN